MSDTDDADPSQEELEKIAVVAMAGRFPGASSVEVLWDRLCRGDDCVSTLGPEDLAADGVDPIALSMPDFVNRAGVLEDVELFDATLFGYAPREAEVIDPQQRMFLECAWETLERAGHVPGVRSDSVGVYAGASMSGYGLMMLTTGLAASYGDLDVLINNDKDFLATRAAYKLGLKGPAITVQTACSTSLVAVATAVEALRNYHCDLALAGGATVNVPHRQGYFYRAGGIASKDGFCRTFDVAAGGTVGGNGVGIVALKRLSDAIADRDHIHAVISGVGLNNDGTDKVGFTAPSVHGQAAAIALAQAQARIDPGAIGYVECHGTATPLGDPIEVAALRDVFATGKARPGRCAIGSIKSNLGHLDCAAGVAGLIKAVLAVEHGRIPPSLHFTAANPELGLEGSPFFVNTSLRDWDGEGTRIAGVSSFGIGGTNAHVIVEQAPVPAPPAPYENAVLLPVSARTRTALWAASEALARRFEEAPGPLLADAAFTLQTGRRALPARRFAVARTHLEAATALREAATPARATPDDMPPQIAFLIPGQGSQRAGALAEIHAAHPGFAGDLDAVARLFEPLIGWDLREYLLAKSAAPVSDTRRVQPILFAQSFALARLLERLGLRPQAMLGHSLGELVAATLVGSFRLEDAVDAVAFRADAMASAAPGAMVSLAADAAAAETLIADLTGAEIAALNGPAQTVVSGPAGVMDEVEAQAATAGVAAVRLSTSHAFHSASMAPAAEAVAERFSLYRLVPPATPFLSNVSGDWIDDAEAVDPAYWAAQIRRAVRFGPAMERLFAREGSLVLELGHGTLLGTHSAQLAHASASAALPVLPRDAAGDGWAALLAALGRAWVEGAAIDWSALYPPNSRRIVALPTYPFERQRYWANFASELAAATAEPSAIGGAGAYLHRWIREAAIAPPALPDGATLPRCLVVGDIDGALIPPLARAWRASGADCEIVPPDPDAIAAAERPEVVLLVEPAGRSPEEAFLGLADLLKAVDARTGGEPALALLVTRALFDVTGAEALDTASAPLEALARCVPQERPSLRMAVVDWTGEAPHADWTARQIVAGCLTDQLDLTNAFRGRTRWTRRPEPMALTEGRIAANTVLITGGSGRLGQALAGGLAERGVKTVALLSRDPAPLGDELRAAAERAGCRILTVAGDVADPAALEAALRTVRSSAGPIDGLIHAAGLTSEAGFRPLDQTDAELVRRQFAPKVAGTRNLIAALDGEPAWGVLFSSISGLLGGLGFAAYAGANLYLDAAATAARRNDGGTAWTSIQWDAFADEGQGVGLSADEALMVVAAAAAAGTPPSFLVSAGELEERIAHWLLGAGAAAPEPEAAEQRRQRHERPALSSEFAAPESEDEERMRAIWERLLGISGLGTTDDFFELGGHSLLGVQLIGQVREAFGANVAVSDIFETPTIRGLTARAAAARVDTEAALES